ISFYLRDKRVEGPGHPPVYIIESQDLINEFSFWPRYDQFVESPAKSGRSADEAFTEQKGENLFMGRNALLIRNYAQKPPHNIRVLRFEKNAGQRAALYAGVRAARGKTVVMIDSDLQNDPADIPRLLEEISRGADLVCGYRARRKDTIAKRLTSRVANFVRSRFTKDYVRDTGCTLKAMRRECVDALVPFKGMHRFIPA